MFRGRFTGALAATAAALLALAGGEVARAGADTVRDGNDPGRLDIRSVSHGHSGARVTHTIRMFERWPSSVFGPQESNALLLWFSTDADRAFERFVLVSQRSRLVASVFRGNGGLLGRAKASRPDRRSVRVTLSKSQLGNPAGYRWQAFSSFLASGACRRGCVDRAPNGSRRLLHDLRAPAISFPQPQSPAATNPYELAFTVRDRGGSSLDFWRLQRRAAGAWVELKHGSGTGARSVPFTATAGATDEFRVAAEDEHGNRTLSPIRRVAAPPAP